MKVLKLFGGLFLVATGLLMLFLATPIFYQRVNDARGGDKLATVFVLGSLILFMIGVVFNGIMILLKILAPNATVAKKILAWWEEKEDKK